jgi:hypothetical protein
MLDPDMGAGPIEDIPEIIEHAICSSFLCPYVRHILWMGRVPVRLQAGSSFLLNRVLQEGVVNDIFLVLIDPIG